MLPLILILVLILGAGLAHLPLSEKRLRQLGASVLILGAGLAGYIAWPGFAATHTFGPGLVWHVDALATLMVLLIATVSVSVGVASYRYLGQEYTDRIVSLNDLRAYYTMVPLFVAAMYAATLSNHVGLIWVALEATTLATTLLIAFYRKRSALEAAWKYVLLCSLGMALGMVGLILAVAASGQHGPTSSLLLSQFHEIATGGDVNVQLMRWAFVFVFIGLGTKVGFVPMHSWLPDAHSKTPSPVSALLSGVLLNVSLVSLLRFREVVDIAVADDGAWTSRFFLVFGVLSIVLPAFIMLVQKNYKRLLAYSSIEHMGLMAFAIGLGPAGLIPAIMHLPGHALLKSTLFLGSGEIFTTYKTTDSQPISDVWYRLPKTALLFLLALLMLLAVPPSAVFVSDLLMVGFGLRAYIWPTLLVVAALTMVFMAMFKHVYALLFATRSARAHEAWNVTHTVMLLQLLLVLALGIAYLTPQGLEFMVSIAQSLNQNLL